MNAHNKNRQNEFYRGRINYEEGGDPFYYCFYEGYVPQHDVFWIRQTELKDYFQLKETNPEIFEFIPDYRKGAETGNPFILVLDRDGRIEGLMAARIYKHSITNYNRPCAEMLFYGISPLYRDMGYVAELWIHLERQLKNRKVLYIFQIMPSWAYEARKFMYSLEFKQMFIDAESILLYKYLDKNADPTRDYKSRHHYIFLTMFLDG